MRFFRRREVMPAHASEVAGLVDLYRRAWAGCERLLDPRLLEDQMPPAAEVGAWLLGGFEIYRVRQEGRLIGAVRCCFPSSACQVDCLAVDPDLRGRGVGHVLLDHAVGRARRAGVTRVWAQVSPKLEPTLALFQAFGFHATTRVVASCWSEEMELLELPV